LPLFEWTIVRLVVSEKMGAATTAKWAPLEKGSKAYVQSVWLNAEKKEIGVEPKGRTFFLTFPLIGLFR
jgi:hypothetical protein